MNLKDHFRSLGTAMPVDVEAPIPSSHAAPIGLEGISASVVTIAADEKTGKGFMVDGEGRIATSGRLVESASRIKVTTFSGDIFLGKVIRWDANRDLALVQIPARTSNYLTLGDAGTVDVGEEVYVLGRSSSGSGKVTKGLIAALRRIEGTALIQLDVPVDPGNLGGPVVTAQGAVVGMSTLKENWGDDMTGFAVSVNEVKAFIYAQ
ncbi:MAG: serine protease [Acidobacteria bacterium]|nr:serine protease [Acidobacteriota bacterium]